jgi:hypothetical protein
MHGPIVMGTQRRWQRVTLLSVLGSEALGALAGGAMLIAAPDGHLMKIPPQVLHGAFRDFLLPGLILFGLGLLNAVAFVCVWRRNRADWLAAGLAIGGLAVWFVVEILIVRELVWLYAMWGLPVLLGGVAAVSLLPFPPAAMRDVWLAAAPVNSAPTVEDALRRRRCATSGWRRGRSLRSTTSR